MKKLISKASIGIAAGILLTIGVFVYLGLNYYMENKATKKIQEWMDRSGWISELTYQSLHAGVFSKKIRMNRISLRIKGCDSPVAIDCITLYSSGITIGIPLDIHVEIQGFHIPPDHPMINMTNITSVRFAQLGYAEMTGDLKCAFQYDPQKKDLDIQQLSISALDMGQLDITASLKNLDLYAIRLIPDNLLMMLPLVSSVSISRISVNYQDHSLVQRYLRQSALQSGQSTEQLVSEIILRLDKEIQKQKYSAVRKILLALQMIVKQSGSIEVTAFPYQPVSLIQVAMAAADPEKITGLLNISAHYREPVQP